jgi:hypothetical protein
MAILILAVGGLGLFFFANSKEQKYVLLTEF